MSNRKSTTHGKVINQPDPVGQSNPVWLARCMKALLLVGPLLLAPIIHAETGDKNREVPDSVPTTPSDLRFLVYSDSAAEIFWNRSSDDGTDNQAISAITLNPFNYVEPFATHSDSWNYRSGMLEISASDGSMLILNPDTGDDDSINIQLIHATETEEFIELWSHWQNLFPRSP